MNELRTILAGTVTRLFTDRITTDVRESAEKGQWPEALWQSVEESGLTLPQIPEARGGAGGTWQDAYVVVSGAGRFAAPLPLAETIVAAWLLSQAGLDVPMGPLTIAPAHEGDRLRIERGALSGTAARVPWGRSAHHVVVLADGAVALVAAGHARVEPDANIALEPRDTLIWDRAPLVAVAPAGPLPAACVPPCDGSARMSSRARPCDRHRRARAHDVAGRAGDRAALRRPARARGDVRE